MNKFVYTTLALALGAMSFTALARSNNDHRYDNDDYRYSNNQNYNQNYNQDYNNGNDDFIYSGGYYNYDQNNSYNHGRYINAKVVRVVPITGRGSNSRQVVCQPAYSRYENQPYGSYQSNKSGINAGVVSGAMIGGVIGNQVANGSNRTAGTIVGATIGGIVGNAIAQNNGNNYRGQGQSNNCYQTQGRYANQIVAYQVTYRYSGHNHTVMMPYYPDKKIRVRVDQPHYNNRQAFVVH